MSEEIKMENQKTRRSAIKTAAQVAVTAPAVGLLLSASTKSAMATTYIQGFSGDDGATPGDDFVSFTQQGDNAVFNDNLVTF